MSMRGTGDSGWDRLRSSWWFGRVPWLIPVVLVAAGVLVNLAMPHDATFVATFSAAPLVAAAVWDFRGTLVTGLVSLGTMTALIMTRDPPNAYSTVLRLATIVLVALLSLAVNDALRHSDRKLASSRRIAEAAQLAVLPTPPARVGGLSVAVRYQAGHAGARIGGDLYAVQATPYGVRMLVGDVRGKGLPAVDTVTVVLGAFREAADREPDLAAAAAWIEHALRRAEEWSPGPDRAEEFVTAVLAEVPARNPGIVRVVNRGHPPPLLLPGDGSVRPLEHEVYALPLGMGELGPPERDDCRDFPWAPGALLLIHTDGVTEARDPHGNFYDPSARLGGRRFPHPEALLDTLVADVARHSRGHTADDMALLAVSYQAREDG